jgi:FAD/FMN-containing dehydrogenase
MTLSEKHIFAIHKILTAGEIIEPASPEYDLQTRVWSGQKNRHPQLVLKPRSLPALQKIIKYLCESDLDFAVRSGGAGSSSASDIVLNISAFNGFRFDKNTEVATVGAGQIWGDIDRKIEESAPGYAGPLLTPRNCYSLISNKGGSGVGVRVPFVGVGGSLSFCVSWISNSFGMGSDPHNLLDARIVLPDGRELWASEDPDLLWALRGGGGNFGGLLLRPISTKVVD